MYGLRGRIECIIVPIESQAARPMLRILAHAAAIVALYLAFSFALFLGLQVRPSYGNIGIAATGVLAGAYVYFGFIRK